MVTTLTWGRFSLELGNTTRIMGIVNVTPDSFSDGGRFFAPERALAQAEQLIAAGADILDIGGESTRPFSDAVSADEESRRVLPLIEKIAGRIPIPVSIDTTKAIVARRAIDAGASIINDIGALRLDPEMAAVAARFEVPVILMHMKGTPKTMQVEPVYADLFGEISDFFRAAVTHAEDNGVFRDKIILDPGIGFGKTTAHNLALVRHLDRIKALGFPVLIGSSRKAFIRKLLADTQGPLPTDSPAVETGTQASVAAAVMAGADIVRVHNVETTRATVKIIDAIKNS
jgi:dihydropteroate synthase